MKRTITLVVTSVLLFFSSILSANGGLGVVKPAAGVHGKFVSGYGDIPFGLPPPKSPSFENDAQQMVKEFLKSRSNPENPEINFHLPEYVEKNNYRLNRLRPDSGKNSRYTNHDGYNKLLGDGIIIKRSDETEVGKDGAGLKGRGKKIIETGKEKDKFTDTNVGAGSGVTMPENAITRAEGGGKKEGTNPTSDEEDESEGEDESSAGAPNITDNSGVTSKPESQPDAQTKENIDKLNKNRKAWLKEYNEWLETMEGLAKCSSLTGGDIGKSFDEALELAKWFFLYRSGGDISGSQKPKGIGEILQKDLAVVNNKRGFNSAEFENRIADLIRGKLDALGNMCIPGTGYWGSNWGRLTVGNYIQEEVGRGNVPYAIHVLNQIPRILTAQVKEIPVESLDDLLQLLRETRNDDGEYFPIIVVFRNFSNKVEMDEPSGSRFSDAIAELMGSGRLRGVELLCEKGNCLDLLSPILILIEKFHSFDHFLPLLSSLVINFGGLDYNINQLVEWIPNFYGLRHLGLVGAPLKTTSAGKAFGKIVVGTSPHLFSLDVTKARIADFCIYVGIPLREAGAALARHGRPSGLSVMCVESARFSVKPSFEDTVKLFAKYTWFGHVLTEYTRAEVTSDSDRLFVIRKIEDPGEDRGSWISSAGGTISDFGGDDEREPFSLDEDPDFKNAQELGKQMKAGTLSAPPPPPLLQIF